MTTDERAHAWGRIVRKRYMMFLFTPVILLVTVMAGLVIVVEGWHGQWWVPLTWLACVAVMWAWGWTIERAQRTQVPHHWEPDENR